MSRQDALRVGALDDGYRSLIAAIITRAVLDATGHCDPLCAQPQDKYEREARAWLQDDANVRDLVELAGYDAGHVLTLLRQEL